MCNIDQTIKNTEEKIEELKHSFLAKYTEQDTFHQNVCVYVCGSMGRLEMTKNSDLDLFFVTTFENDEVERHNCTNLNKYKFFSKLLLINEELNYQDPSKEGLYWDFISLKNILGIGSRQEDYNNSFTARMLLLLESKPIYNEDAYRFIIKEVVNKYFIDYDDHSDNFFPLFLMNDIQRYWYTLTLNYEYRRDENDSPNKKNWRRLKLKYARLITCFSMLACLYIKPITPEYVIECVALTPFQRLEKLSLISPEISDTVDKIKKEYGWFLNLRNTSNPEWWNVKENKTEAQFHADCFHNLVVHDLMGLMSNTNPELKKRADIY